jgi:VWFA-related protein
MALNPESSWWSGTAWKVTAVALAAALLSGVLAARAQAPASQTPSQQQPTKSAPAQDIPDAPSTVQPPPPPQEKLPAQTAGPAGSPPPPANDGAPSGDETQPPPPMPPVETVPPGSIPRQSGGDKEQLYKLVVQTNFVQVPVTVKDRDGRRVDGLLYKDFAVYENGKKQEMKFFTSDPFELSVAVVLDLGMPDVAVQKINQTFPALVGAFSPYDEVALYTYSSTVSQVSDFAAATQKLTAVLNQMKTVRGHNNGPPVLGGPLGPQGPTVNGVPVGGPPVAPVYTPPKEAHVLNDAILRAALDLSKCDRTRRKVIFVISDGREMGSKASYSDVLKLLLAHGIEVKAVAVEGAALPLYNKVEKLRLPGQGYSNILPKYASATGGGQVYTELSRSAIEDAYAQITSEARNQYTLGYTTRATASTAYRNIEVKVDRPGLNIYAKDGYYPVPQAR